MGRRKKEERGDTRKREMKGEEMETEGGVGIEGRREE